VDAQIHVSKPKPSVLNPFLHTHGRPARRGWSAAGLGWDAEASFIILEVAGRAGGGVIQTRRQERSDERAADLKRLELGRVGIEKFRNLLERPDGPC